MTLFVKDIMHLGCMLYKRLAGTELESSSMLGCFKALHGKKIG